MVEIPIWMLGFFIFAIFILFSMLLESNQKIKNINLQTMINSQLVSKSFEEIAIDMDALNDIIRKLDADYEYKNTKTS
jgi:hypothetical protein|tara:strand:+ start:87 stop:320 length:234 start_codon:yes stop_codon:yes gene_type:complete